MNLITINFCKPTVELEFWSQSDKHFDPTVLVDPSTTLFVAKSKEKSVMYMAIQTPLVLGPFCPNPEATKHELAVALREMLVVARVLAQQKGIGRVIILTEDDRIKDFAGKMEMQKIAGEVFSRDTLE